VRFEVPPGEYEVTGWVNVRGTDTLESGDYIGGSGVITVNQDLTSVDLELSEFQQ